MVYHCEAAVWSETLSVEMCFCGQTGKLQGSPHKRIRPEGSMITLYWNCLYHYWKKGLHGLHRNATTVYIGNSRDCSADTIKVESFWCIRCEINNCIVYTLEVIIYCCVYFAILNLVVIAPYNVFLVVLRTIRVLGRPETAQLLQRREFNWTNCSAQWLQK